MEVILKQDVSNIGDKGDIVTVKNGYGRNFLIPKGYALLATKIAKKVHEENIKQRAHKEEKIKDEAANAAKKLEDLTLTIGAKTSSKGKIFGSVNTIQIADAITSKTGVEIDRKNVSIKEDSIKDVGTYTATVKFHKEVKVDITFEVISE